MERVVRQVNDPTGAVLLLITGALAILKLMGEINISWWWVFVPLWGPVALFLVFIAAGLLYIVLDHFIFTPVKRKRRAKRAKKRLQEKLLGTRRRP